jgi:hypothetical protein
MPAAGNYPIRVRRFFVGVPLFQALVRAVARREEYEL